MKSITTPLGAPAFPTNLLAKIQQSLTEEKIKLEKELGKSATHQPEDALEFPDYGNKDDENAAEVADYAATLSLEQTLHKTLRDVNAALERLKNNTYGVCKYCHKPIANKRLLARPTSNSCVECKKAITQEV